MPADDLARDAAPLVEAVDVSVTLDDVVLLPPVSLAAHPGEAVVVTGANGSGKTTLLRVLAGLTRPTTGSARVGGRAIDERDARYRRTLAAHLGLPPFARNLTVREHLTLVGASWGRTVVDAGAAADALLDRVGLRQLAQRFPHELSSGQTQLVALATVLARPFDVLLLDEPEQRLDSDRLGLVGELLAEHVDRGATLVVASHSAVLTEALADRVVPLDEATA